MRSKLLSVLMAVLLLQVTMVPQVFAVSSDVTIHDDGTIKGLYPYYAFEEDPENPWESVYDALDATGTYYYNDNLFIESSSTMSEENAGNLRAVSYALALAGFENKADGYPVAEGEVNPKLRKMLTDMGFDDYAYWDEESERDGHSMGTSIARKTIDTDGGEKELIVVAPRNYNYMTEWLSNFNIGTTGDHAGFAESATLVTTRLNQYISERSLSNYKIWIVGYSRGGAVVDLVGKKINENLTSYDMQEGDLYAYTFGAPRASTTDTKYTNIHDVKDGNDLLLGFVFPDSWGFYNTGVYEEVHPADLEISTSVVDATKLVDSSQIMGLISDSEGLVVDTGTVNALDFMNELFCFFNENGFTREYFDTYVKPPLSDLMQAYQLRKIDEQGEFSNFLSDTESGLFVYVATNAFVDLTTGDYPGDDLPSRLDNYPPYLDIKAILEGTATDTDFAELASFLKKYIGDYEDFYPITEVEFNTVKDSLPALVEALGPILTADAKYTMETYGDNYVFYHFSTLFANANTLLIGHTPESIMPLLMANVTLPHDEQVVPVPDSGANTISTEDSSVTPDAVISVLVVAPFIIIGYYLRKQKSNERRKNSVTIEP